jgi:hypothetical protein
MDFMKDMAQEFTITGSSDFMPGSGFRAFILELFEKDKPY